MSHGVHALCLCNRLVGGPERVEVGSEFGLVLSTNPLHPHVGPCFIEGIHKSRPVAVTLSSRKHVLEHTTVIPLPEGPGIPDFLSH